MINLSGLSAVYPGYQAAENTQATTEQNQAAAREAAIKLLGQQVLGRAFTGGMGAGGPQMAQAGPQPPAPGQASVPNQPAPAPPQGAPPAAAAPPTPAPAAAPGGTPGGMGEISLDNLRNRILQTSPQVAQHPEILMAALERAAPILDRASRDQLAEIRQDMQRERLKQTGELAQARIDAAKAAEAGRQGRADTAEAGKQGRFDAREARLAASTAVRQDQGWQRLDMQRQDMERKVEQGGDKQALAQWRAVVDAQHKRATEIIQANGVMSGLKPAQTKELMAEQDRVYQEAVTGMRTRMTEPKAAAPAAAAAPAPGAPSAPAAAAPAAMLPPAAMLRPGGINVINGKGYRLVNGQAVEVPLPGQAQPAGQ